MKYGYVRVAAATPKVKVGDCIYNADKIIDMIKEAKKNNIELLTFPELSLTGYTCGDLFYQNVLIDDAFFQLLRIAEETKNINITSVVGIPVQVDAKLYNCGAVIYGGEIKGIVPKTFLPNYNEFYEKRHFEKAPIETTFVNLNGKSIPFGTKVIFDTGNYAFAIELCEDLWSTIPPSSYHALAGADVILNLSAGNEITGKDIYRRELVKGQSARLISGYIYACAGDGESTTDVVFSGHNIICENGKILAESKRFENGLIYNDIDVSLLQTERRRNTSFHINTSGYTLVSYEMKETDCETVRFIDPMPFVPSDDLVRTKRCKEIIDIQAYGLKKRIEHIGCKNVVVGVSGGLDSTQALIICIRAFELLNLDKKGIITVTMPCFGTTDRTYNNAVNMCKLLGTTLIEVNIKDAVKKHFEDISHDINVHNLTYENSQARERTQVLMDIASKYNGFVVGTGDLSELALGFATFNGDHMSMYGVNASVPKTLIRYLIDTYAKEIDNDKIANILRDILDTPVSPELLPPNKDGEINQVTEDIVGPYELHDFFLYNMMRLCYEPEKIYYIACIAFKGRYNDKEILKWLKKFYYRFFAQQYKRSTLPDGPKVGSVSLSPRGDFRMPSDAVPKLWIERLEKIKM